VSASQDKQQCVQPSANKQQKIAFFACKKQKNACKKQKNACKTKKRQEAATTNQITNF